MGKKKQVIYTAEANNLQGLEDKVQQIVDIANSQLGYKVSQIAYNTRPNYSAIILCDLQTEAE